MPCSNLTENLKIVIDYDNHLLNYEFKKLGCGAPIGSASLLLNFFSNQNLETIVNTTYYEIKTNHSFDDQVDEFIYGKHYLALISAIRVYCGWEKGVIGDSCVIESIINEEDKIIIDFLLTVDLSFEKIKPCLDVNVSEVCGQTCHCVFRPGK